jgi:hypothetical protein
VRSGACGACGACVARAWRAGGSAATLAAAAVWRRWHSGGRGSGGRGSGGRGSGGAVAAVRWRRCWRALVARDEDVRALAVAQDVRRGVARDERIGVGDDGVGSGLEQRDDQLRLAQAQHSEVLGAPAVVGSGEAGRHVEGRDVALRQLDESLAVHGANHIVGQPQPHQVRRPRVRVVGALRVDEGDQDDVVAVAVRLDPLHTQPVVRRAAGQHRRRRHGSAGRRRRRERIRQVPPQRFVSRDLLQFRPVLGVLISRQLLDLLPEPIIVPLHLIKLWVGVRPVLIRITDRLRPAYHPGQHEERSNYAGCHEGHGPAGDLSLVRPLLRGTDEWALFLYVSWQREQLPARHGARFLERTFASFGGLRLAATGPRHVCPKACM